jgi:hypothetical protein
MAIPESQLDTWSHQGSIIQSSTTYNTIKNVLDAAGNPYAGKNYNVFLQGSYGNDTNIYAESDVDIVIKLNDCFHHDLNELPDSQKTAFKVAHSDATYTRRDFKRDVLRVLKANYGNNVDPGDKAIKIAANGSRRKTDVIAAIQYRRYHKFLSISNQDYDEGICFFNGAGECIANYPKQHSANCTAKHQSTDKWFKPMVRILKNLRGKLVENKMIEAGVAPSYYIEGLLYNVPEDKFGKSYADSFINCIGWILEADRNKFVCANEQYLLLHEESPVTWRESKCNLFLTSACELWEQW